MITGSFTGPFMLNFIIWMVILDMQFLWLYVDDLMGKGLDWSIILELMLYASANWVPLALPLSVLLASIMCFGSLGEKNELLALKSAGISLFKIMKPLVFVIFLISTFAFYFTNSLWPIAHFKMRVLLRDIQNTKVAIALQPGVFFKTDDFAIRIGNKNKKGDEFTDILIYDHSNNGKQPLGSWSYNNDPRDFKKVIRAKKGKLINPKNKSRLDLELYDGFMIQEWDSKSFSDTKNPFTKYNFKKSTISFQLNSFEFERSSEKNYKKDNHLLNLNQIAKKSDSIGKEMIKNYNKIEELIQKEFYQLIDSNTLDSIAENITDENKINSFIEDKKKSSLVNDYKVAVNKLSKISSRINNFRKRAKFFEESKIDLIIEWNRKFTLSYAVFMLFFLGGPLGAIVKKGGLGWPVITAILIFLVYFMLTRAGEEMASNYNIGPNFGMWLSAICITPVSIFIFYKANRDAKIFDLEWYKNVFLKAFK